jgi:hypothetical protein
MSQTVILWAESVASFSGGGNPNLALGEPDANVYGLSLGKSATLANFRGRFYRGLSELLSTVIAGDPVKPPVLETADVIAFEGNGGSPAYSGGWESCDWHFEDGNNTLTVKWDEAKVLPNPRDPHVVANGSITVAAYGAFFGLPSKAFSHWGGSSLEELVVSFLLFRLRPEIDTASPSFRITIIGVPPEPYIRESSPEPDAIGILACHHEETHR